MSILRISAVCASLAAYAAAAQTPPAAPVTPAQPVTAPHPPGSAPAAAKPPQAGAAEGGQPVFPTSIAAKYAKETPSKARLHTCRDQYNANKATQANGGLKWIQKGGGYYSACGKKLKN